ncbi:MAG: NADP-dependent phosphogluconate dehydrogenase [Acidobacteriota bacterium]
MQKFGVIGLGVMGQNLALNVERNGFSVAGFDLDGDKRQASQRAFAGKDMSVASSLHELVRELETPRKILMMVPAGGPVDAVIQDIAPLLSAGDILIDGGNSYFLDTVRRAEELEAKGIRYIGMGVSGGEKGALFGPSIMPGGPEAAYRQVEPILTSIAAQVDDGPCCAYIGPGGSGHYVKMIHNGIEYAIMQLICEAYDILKSGLGLSADEIQQVFSGWNQGELNSFLIEITALVLGKKDEETQKPLVELILDKAGQKGTGKWTSQNALDLGVATPTINAAVEARILSAFKEQRVAAARVLQGPGKTSVNQQDFTETLRGALGLAIITSYAQGFALLCEASGEYSFQLKFKEIARIWKGGCIIRARLLDSVQAAFERNPDLPNLLVDSEFSLLANQLQEALRQTVSTSAGLGIPCLALSASLGYFDSYRRERLPANLLQAQRDYFGAHTYRRIDKDGVFHTEWEEQYQ